jgi:hypothetical protein
MRADPASPAGVRVQGRRACGGRVCRADRPDRPQTRTTGHPVQLLQCHQEHCCALCAHLRGERPSQVRLCSCHSVIALLPLPSALPLLSRTVTHTPRVRLTDKVSKHWPEFAQKGKGSITVAMVIDKGQYSPTIALTLLNLIFVLGAATRVGPRQRHERHRHHRLHTRLGGHGPKHGGGGTLHTYTLPLPSPFSSALSCSHLLPRTLSHVRLGLRRSRRI